MTIQRVLRSMPIVPGEVTVAGQVYTKSVIITPMLKPQVWNVDTFVNLQAAHIEQLLKLKPEILLLWVGEQLRFPELQLLTSVYQARVGLEVMDNAAVCRTYNILVAEQRKVVAGIIIDTLC